LGPQHPTHHNDYKKQCDDYVEDTNGPSRELVVLTGNEPTDRCDHWEQ
jgi:hypothetical protein